MLKKIARHLLNRVRKKKPQPGIIPKKKIKKYLNKNAIILEAGAADGGDTKELSSVFPNGKIYTFEPVPEFYAELKNTLKDCRNVELFSYALGSKSGLQTFNVSRNIRGELVSSGSLLKPKEHLNDHPEILFDDTITVPTITIDDFCDQNNIHRIDFLWLDLQGCEYQVLKSSPRILKTVKVIHTEVSLVQAYEDTLMYPEFKNWLSVQGFHAVIEELPWKDMGNVLFVKN